MPKCKLGVRPQNTNAFASQFFVHGTFPPNLGVVAENSTLEIGPINEPGVINIEFVACEPFLRIARTNVDSGDV